MIGKYSGLLALPLGALLAMNNVLPVWALVLLLYFAALFAAALILMESEKKRSWLENSLSPASRSGLYFRLVGPVKDLPRDWRLYDWAMRLAVIYPILLAFLPWLATGAAVTLGGTPEAGGVEIVAAEPRLWPRLAAIFAMAFALIGPRLPIWAKACPRVFLRKLSGWLPWFAFALSGSFAFAVMKEASFVFAILVSFAIGASFAVTGAFAISGLFAIGIAVAFGIGGPVIGAFSVSSLFANIGVFAFSVSIATVGAFAVELVLKDTRFKGAYLGFTVFMALELAATLAFLDWTEVGQEIRVLFLFLGILPLLNAIFDYFSYWITLTFLSLGAEHPRGAVVYGLADLAAAALLFLLSGSVLVLTVAGANHLSGVELFPLAQTFHDVPARPWDYWWLYAMLFSTVIPTMLHLGVATFSLSATLLPRLRAWLLKHLDSEDSFDQAGVLGGLTGLWGISLAAPFLAMAGICLLLWPLASDYLLMYLDGLQWVACMVDTLACKAQ